ncbi:coenzyme F390 synthetase [Legionella quinlivanii]|uniref:Coenzyme F390 synthetase n=1 Tax=Legionella quinlivanii TaxID=45073 RepID=A0A0W0Y023_9GAMM|nr:phenylacetate--CoA ligase family protein [Legionella quinlivanii]KTD50331.1 coenzyme F390 synthetase [Legionella quinlivanii]MCW8449922.1 phenylacetate--CoA ligase family protein [Legionella quinlivanii]SEF43311.1 Phenylacetate-coenzyme A ligase PaaK, adenylate-forming domain family [Legionella quinlivanii DSM 21216]STY11931.1 Coenzyme F390 synthetase [Legionella quinlivanii]
MPTTYELRIKQTEDMLGQFERSYEALSWSKQRISEHRNYQLRKLLHYAKKHSPWYQKQLAHINLELFTEERLPEIPAMDKKTLMDNWDEIVTDKRLSLKLVEDHIDKMKDDGETLYLLDEYHVLATSGSSGKRAIYVYNWDEWNTYYLHSVRYASRQPIPRRANQDAKKLKMAMILISNTVYAMYSMIKTFQHDHVEQFHISITQPTEQIINELNTIQPDYLLGTPTTIARICHEPYVNRLKIDPVLVSVSGEPLFTPIRQLIEKAWPNARINNAYGCSEGLAGSNCGVNSREMHLNEDGCILEPVDAEEQRVPLGVIPQKMYLTNLYFYTLPLIRYEFFDQLLFLDKPCICGSNHQLIAEPEGRPEYDFMYPGNVFVHHLAFVTPLLLEKNIQEYQVVQTEKGAHVRVMTTGLINKQLISQSIGHSLKQAGLERPEISFEEVTEFEYLSSGKLRRFLKLR